MSSQRYKFSNVKSKDILRFTKEELSGGKNLVGYTINSVDGAITAFKNEDPLGIGISSISSNGTIRVISNVLDLSNLVVGSTFKLGKYQVESETPWPIEWEIVHQESDYQIAMTKQIIDLRCFDAKEPTNTDNNRKKYGNNNWQYSNIEQFLNSDQNSWYSAQHQYDTPPSSANVWINYNSYDNHKGFLYHWNEDEKKLLKDMTLTLANNTVTDGGGSYTWTGKVFLPTYTQMGFGNNNNIAEGIKFSKFTDDTSRIKTINKYCAENNKWCIDNNNTEGTNWFYWMSSVNPSYSFYARGVADRGLDNYGNAFNGNLGLAPCICLPRYNGGGVINNTITFYIDNVEYKSPKGYTFSQWINTSYNKDGYYNTGVNIVNYNTNKGIKGISTLDIIKANKNYTVGDMVSYNLNDTFKLGKYQVESETPWDIEWEVVDKRDGYVVAMTKQIIDLRCFDAKEPNNPDGNNDWQYSNIEQFLNSDQSSWYKAQHQYDAPPSSVNCYHYTNGTTFNAYDTHKGFLYHWSNEDKLLLKDMTLTLAITSIDGGESYTWTGKVWLPTYTQMGFGQNNSISEGVQFSKFTDNASRIKSLHPNCAANNEYCKINNSSGNYWYWMSSVLPALSGAAHIVGRRGSSSGNSVYSGSYGLAPCICLPDIIIK